MAEKVKQNQVVDMMESWFAKLPVLPTNWKEVIVKITPWLALVFGVLGVLASLAAFGFLSAFAPMFLVGNNAEVGGGILGAILALVASVLLLAAFPGTKNRKMSGWTLLFWSELVSLVASVAAFSFAGVLGAVIGFYILFQIKSFYK